MPSGELFIVNLFESIGVSDTLRPIFIPPPIIEPLGLPGEELIKLFLLSLAYFVAFSPMDLLGEIHFPSRPRDWQRLMDRLIAHVRRTNGFYYLLHLVTVQSRVTIYQCGAQFWPTRLFGEMNRSKTFSNLRV